MDEQKRQQQAYDQDGLQSLSCRKVTDFAGNVFPGNISSGNVLPGKVTFQKTTVNGLRHRPIAFLSNFVMLAIVHTHMHTHTYGHRHKK